MSDLQTLTEVHEKLAAGDELFWKQAEEEDAAGRIMARGFADELNKLAQRKLPSGVSPEIEKRMAKAEGAPATKPAAPITPPPAAAAPAAPKTGPSAPVSRVSAVPPVKKLKPKVTIGSGVGVTPSGRAAPGAPGSKPGVAGVTFAPGARGGINQ